MANKSPAVSLYKQRLNEDGKDGKPNVSEYHNLHLKCIHSILHSQSASLNLQMSISMDLFVWVIYLLMFSVVTVNVKLYDAGAEAVLQQQVVMLLG